MNCGTLVLALSRPRISRLLLRNISAGIMTEYSYDVVEKAEGN